MSRLTLPQAVRLLLPRTLVGRVFALFAVSMLVFAGLALGLFYRDQYMHHIDETQDAANTLVAIAAQAVEESAIIGDYDTVKRTLSTMMVQSPFRSAAFIDLNGGTIRVDAVPAATLAPAPGWLLEHVGAELYDVNRVVTAGGKDYGVLRLQFDAGRLAAQLWLLLVQSALLAAAVLAVSLAVARALLAR